MVFEALYLFGSTARDVARQNSDVDIFIELSRRTSSTRSI